MRILQVINWLEYGGAERLVYNFVRCVKQSYPGYDVDVCTLMREGALGKKLREEGIKVYNLEVGRWDFFRGIWRLSRLIRKERYDVVHAHLFPTSYYVSIGCRLSQFKVCVYTEHSIWNRRRGKPQYRPIEAFIYDGYDAIIANSEESRSALLSWIPGVIDKICVIENGAPVPRTPKDRFDLSNVPSMLVIGRLVQQKGIDIAINTVRILGSEGVSISLSIAGDGPERANLQKLAQGLPVEFLGTREDTDRLMAQHDILLVPSRHEGFGLTPVEGMLAGVPVIASNIDALSRVIEDGYTGLHFQPGDARDLAEKIRVLLFDDRLRQKLAVNGRKKALKKWSIDRYVDDLLADYRDRLERKSICSNKR